MTCERNPHGVGRVSSKVAPLYPLPSPLSREIANQVSYENIFERVKKKALLKADLGSNSIVVEFFEVL